MTDLGKRIEEDQNEIEEFEKETHQYQQDVEKVIDVIAKKGEQLKDLIDEKIRNVIKSVKVNENIPEVNKYDVQREIRNMLEDLKFGKKQYKYECVTCRSVLTSTVLLENIVNNYSYGCEECKMTIRSAEKPLEYLCHKYEFYCRSCKLTITMRTEPASYDLPIPEEDYKYTFVVRKTPLNDVLDTKRIARRPPGKEYTYECRCGEKLSLQYFGERKDNPRLTTDYQYTCDRECGKTITTEVDEKYMINQDWKITEEWVLQDPMVNCVNCGKVQTAKNLGEIP